MTALLPCPFCGGPAREPIMYNGTLETGCASDYVKCAGVDVLSPLAMWNARPSPARDEMSELLPCPWCGGPGSPTEYLKDGSASRWHRIICEACEIVGPEVEGHGLSFHGATGKYEAEAVTAWNTRPSPARDEGAGTMGRGEEFLEFKEALSDLRSLRHEYECLNGGGPGWQARNAEAWKRADELFADEDEAAWQRQQEDAHG